MKDDKDVGLENVEIVDFIDDEEPKPEAETKKTEEKKCEASLEGITSYPWKNVSHIVIGPSGVSLVPTGSEQKYSMPNSNGTTYPTPGQAPTMLEYDLTQLVGAMNAVSDLEKELANTRAELERTKAQLEELQKPKPEEEKPEEMPPEDEPKKDEKKPEDEPEMEKPAEAPAEEPNKEEEAKDEKKDAETKDKADAEQTADHEESNLATAMRLMKVAKERHVL